MLSLILPTYNEKDTLAVTLDRAVKELQSIPHEIIIVDDNSPDETWRLALEKAKAMPTVRVVRRIARYGLSSAVIEGFLAAKGDVLAVMDADGQHDAGLLAAMYKAVENGDQLVIGSRYMEGGSVGEWDERRHTLSRIATRLAIKLCTVKVHDPMSGFFAIDRKTFERTVHTLNPKGFKILLDILVCVPSSTRVKELPLRFQKRIAGESKLSRRVQLEFLEYLYDVTLGRYIPSLFIKYCLVGTLGVIVNFVSFVGLSLAMGATGIPSHFSLEVLGATEIAILYNFLLNNYWTFGLHKLKGISMIIGFLKFNIACAFGALTNVAVSSFMITDGYSVMGSVVTGAAIAAVWNYTMSRMFTWKL